MIDAGPGSRGILGDQPPADRKGSNARNLAFLDERELGGAAADVGMERAGTAPPRKRSRAGSVSGQNAFELVAGGGADEFTRFSGEDFVDRAGIFSFDRLAGEDHGAAVDIAAAKPGVVIGVVYEMFERVGIDGAVGKKRREHDRRAPDDLPLD